MTDDRKNGLLRLTLFLTTLAAIGLITRQFHLARYLDQERLQSWILEYGSTGPILYILVFTVAPALFLPALPITVAGGVMFGPVWGTVYASIGSTLGAALSFLISRYFAREQVQSLLGPRLQAIDAGVERKGWLYVATTRLIPIFPYILLNYAFGLTKIRFIEYLITSWICMLPATAVYVIFSSSLVGLIKGHVSKELLFGILLFLILTLIPILYKRIQRVKRDPI